MQEAKKISAHEKYVTINKQHIDASYGHLISLISTKEIKENLLKMRCMMLHIPTIPGKLNLGILKIN